MKKAYLHKTGAMVFNQEGRFDHVLRETVAKGMKQCICSLYPYRYNNG